MEELTAILRYLKAHPEVTWSGAGITGLGSLYFLGSRLLTPLFRKDKSPSGNNAFTSGGGEQNNALGDRPIGSQTNISGVPPEMLAKYAEELGETKQIINSFFGTLLEQKVPCDKWDSQLREIANEHKELLLRLKTVSSEDPEVLRLKEEARQAVQAGDYTEAEALLNRAEALDLGAIEAQEKATAQRRLSAAESNAALADLQRVQLRYAEAALYWQKAAGLLPEGNKQELADYLGEAGYDLHRIGSYDEALPLFERSLSIRREIGDRAGEGTTLNNISQIYSARGDYGAALKYLEESLSIRREIGDRAGEAVTSWNIGRLYQDQGDLIKAEQYMSRTVQIDEEIGHPDLEQDRQTLKALRAEIQNL